MKTTLLLLMSFILSAPAGYYRESDYSALLARCWLAQTETRLNYRKNGASFFVRVDIETPTHMIEVGFDKRESYDSLHQVEMFALLKPDKKTAILILDRDNHEGTFERQIKLTAQKNGILFLRIPTQHIEQGFCPSLKR